MRTVVQLERDWNSNSLRDRLAESDDPIMGGGQESATEDERTCRGIQLGGNTIEGRTAQQARMQQAKIQDTEQFSVFYLARDTTAGGILPPTVAIL